MTDDRPQVTMGMEVVGADMHAVGIVEDVRDDDFLVAEREPGSVFVPFDAVLRLTGNQVVLKMRAEEVDLQNWPRLPTIGSVSAGMESSPGPAGSGMPFVPPGSPTGFTGAQSPDAPAAGTGELTDET